MRVILMADMQRLGKVGDLVSVKDGHGRNYLIPQGLALEADPKNVKAMEELKRMAERKAERKQTEARQLAETVAGQQLTFVRHTGEEGKLFGSVTNMDIQQELAKAGITLDRKQILLKDPIKSLGEHLVKVKVGPQEQVELKVTVVPHEEPSTSADPGAPEE